MTRRRKSCSRATMCSSASPRTSRHSCSRPTSSATSLRVCGRCADYDVKLALPGHGEPFSGLARRVDELIAHHEARLLPEMEDLGQAPAITDIIDITSSASWKYPDWESWAMEQKFFSLGETLARLRACRALRDDTHHHRRRSRRILPRGIARRFRFAIH